MKRNRLFLPLAVLGLLFSFGLTACNGGGTPSSQKQEKITVTAEGGKNKLILGETVQLTASVEGVAWESKQPSVATVSDAGLVTSVAVGTAQITASKEGYRLGSINITVDLPSITVSSPDNKTSLVIGTTLQLSSSETGVTWASSDPAVASVSDTGLVEGLKYGSAEISAAKDGFNTGRLTISVTRPAPIATLHMEDADHFAADGQWKSSSRGPGDTPVYSPSSGNPSDGTCIAYFGVGDKETLTFTSDKAITAEVVVMIGYYYSIDDLTLCYEINFNGALVTMPAQGYVSEGTTGYSYKEMTLGELNIIAGTNVLEFNMLDTAASQYFPYMDDVFFYANESANIQVVKPAEKDPVVVNEENLSVMEGKTVQITSAMTDLSYRSADTSIATVDENGLVKGIKAGSTNIAVSKQNYKTITVPVTVTEDPDIIVVSIQGLTGEGISTRESQNISGDNKYIIDDNGFPVGAVGTLEFDATAAGTFDLYMRCRASGGYNSTTTDNLETGLELKINGVKLDLTGTVSGSSFKDYLLGEVTLAVGKVTIEITCITSVPTINLFRFVPKA